MRKACVTINEKLEVFSRYLFYRVDIGDSEHWSDEVEYSEHSERFHLDF